MVKTIHCHQKRPASPTRFRRKASGFCFFAQNKGVSSKLSDALKLSICVRRVHHILSQCPDLKYVKINIALLLWINFVWKKTTTVETSIYIKRWQLLWLCCLFRRKHFNLDVPNVLVCYWLSVGMTFEKNRHYFQRAKVVLAPSWFGRLYRSTCCLR